MSERIKVTYIGPTDTKGSRLKATFDGRQITKPFDYSSNNPSEDLAKEICGEDVVYFGSGRNWEQYYPRSLWAEKAEGE